MIDVTTSRSSSGVLRLEALHYRCLRYVDQSLGPFHVLMGPNASGKSTFLDVMAFLGDLLRHGLQAAIAGDTARGIPLRATDGQQLTWMRHGGCFELAVEMAIPEERRERLRNGGAAICRYEVAVDVTGPLRIVAETLWLKPRPTSALVQTEHQRVLFPETREGPESIVRSPNKRTPLGWKKVVSRGEQPERVTFHSETSGWNNPFRIAADKSALASLPADEERFPVATWFRDTMDVGVQRIVLSGEDMRRPCPPGRPRAYLPDGSNLPHVVHSLERDNPDRHAAWIQHVREALPDFCGITTREREEDRHRYLVLSYDSGLEAPSWLVSDGTLRLLALTLLAYLPDPTGIFLIEEPENGIHPRAVETVIQSLSSVYGAQVLLASHSPLVASLVDLERVLCFARTDDGATDIVAGSEHPRLREWKGTADLGTLLASGVLG